MPYGGNIFGTVAADLVQTDTDAIVQGLAGSPGGRTLAELHERIGGGLFDAGGDPLLERLIGALDLYLYNGELLEPRIGYTDHPDVGLDGREGVVGRQCTGLGQCVEQRGLAHVGQADDTDSQGHEVQSRSAPKMSYPSGTVTT